MNFFLPIDVIQQLRYWNYYSYAPIFLKEVFVAGCEKVWIW
ncbi:hypothetical protein DWUX_1382 [Desulfovibrio diazotrophicus]|nr:hypothetical protein DWUX_1382 [Desulfovibrio diazotrophicus]